jgi:RNA polymerase sporulation-specific sigma factor
VKITTYSVPYIIGEIKRFIRDDGPIKVSRSIKELSYKINEIQRQNINEKGEELNIQELAKKLNVEKEEIVVALEASRKLESIDEELYDEEGGGESRISRITANKDESSSIIDKICLKELISELETRERQIIILRYYKDKTQTEVAKTLGITQVQVSRIEKRILSEMRRKIA